MYLKYFFVIGIVSNIVKGVSPLVYYLNDPCSLPNGDKGICKPLKDCAIINTIFNKPRRKNDEVFLEQLTKSKCNYEGKESEVCCPISDKLSCITKEKLEGQCVSISGCPHLAALPKDKKYAALNDYACSGPDLNSVCCGWSNPAEFAFRTEYEKACEKDATSFPPDPGSDCCGLDDTVGDKILGGEDASIDAYPWLAAIEYVRFNERFLFCGGSLISVKYVLTAAHCVKGPILFVGKPKFVRLGEYNVATRGPDCIGRGSIVEDCNHGAIVIPIERSVTHPDFRPYHSARRHDIALIRLKNVAPYTAFIRPICLPSKDYTLSPPDKLFVAGWGTYKQNVTANIYWTSDVKQFVEIPYVDQQKCEKAIQNIRNTTDQVIWEGQICAGGVPGKDSCNADSGGPLMVDSDRMHEVLGIVSFGADECGKDHVPAVYTYVYHYVPWIKRTIKP